jgi:serine/threonine protein kinase
VADALSACHAQGAIHRDIKPGNIFVIRTVSGEERIKLIDFGISRPGKSSERKHIKLTMADSLLGTAEYMAPEQLLNPEHIDARVDVYALGITMFEMLTGVVPFSGNLPEIIVKVTTQTAPSARTLRPDLPDSLAAILAMAVMRAPNDRFASAAALSGALASTGLAATRTNLLAQTRSSLNPSGSNIAAMLEEIMSRRKHSRAPYITPVRVTMGNKTIEARSEDVSEGGLLVITSLPIPENQTVVMQFALPATGELVTCYGEVRWTRPRPDNPHAPCATGIQFSGLAESALMVIRHYVSVAGYPD